MILLHAVVSSLITKSLVPHGRITIDVCLNLLISVVFLRELTLLWSKLQRRIDASLESFFERCLQFGAIAKTIYHLLFLIRVIQTEVNTYFIFL